ncbi:MAG: FapA family protein [Cyanobacteriota bacterium]
MHKALQIDIKDNGLTATMTIIKSVLAKQRELQYPGLPDVQAACEESRVVFGIDEKKIVDNLKFKDTPIAIAKGHPATPTIHDQIIYSFKDMRNHKFTPTVLANDKADYYDFIHFKLVQPNELLAFIRKGRQGDNGTNVFGEVIYAEKFNEISHEILKRLVGSNTELTNKGIISKIQGIPLFDASGKISVSEVYTIPKDIDFNTGSIEFDGSVIVKGSIKHNFAVKTPHDVLVEGIVDGGIIEAGGMVSLLGGITRGKVKSGKILIAKYIYGSEIICKSTVIVDEAIFNSDVKAKTVISKGTPGVEKSGQISGGRIIANNFVWARNLGSPSSNYTEIFITMAVDDGPYKFLLRERHNLNNEIDKYVRNINNLDELKTNVTFLPPDFKKTQYQLYQLLKKTELKLKKIQAHIHKLEQEINEEEKTNERKIYIPHALYPKVHITISKKNLLTKNDYGASIVHISEEKNTLDIEPFVGTMELPEGYDNKE